MPGPRRRRPGHTKEKTLLDALMSSIALVCLRVTTDLRKVHDSRTHLWRVAPLEPLQHVLADEHMASLAPRDSKTSSCMSNITITPSQSHVSLQVVKTAATYSYAAWVLTPAAPAGPDVVMSTGLKCQVHDAAQAAADRVDPAALDAEHQARQHGALAAVGVVVQALAAQVSHLPLFGETWSGQIISQQGTNITQVMSQCIE